MIFCLYANVWMKSCRVIEGGYLFSHLRLVCWSKRYLFLSFSVVYNLTNKARYCFTACDSRIPVWTCKKTSFHKHHVVLLQLWLNSDSWERRGSSSRRFNRWVLRLWQIFQWDLLRQPQDYMWNPNPKHGSSPNESYPNTLAWNYWKKNAEFPGFAWILNPTQKVNHPQASVQTYSKNHTN